MNVYMRNKLRCSMQILSVIAVNSALTTFAWGQVCGDPLSGLNKNCEPISRWSNMGSIANTRHNMRGPDAVNLTSPFPAGIDVHNAARNDYQEVCVYCHTPHGANSDSAIRTVPLWNRTIRPTNYQTYNQLGTGSFSVAPGASMQPGAASLSCLSCHDGQTAIDSIINMPSVTRTAGYSGRYLGSQQTSQNITFLNSWNNPNSGYVKTGLPPNICCTPDTVTHAGMNSYENTAGYKVSPNGLGQDIGCLTCHSGNGADAIQASTDHDMRLAFIGTDLRNDHPIGVKFPTTNGAGTDWKTPTAAGSISFFESGAANGQAGLDKSDIRLYQTAGEARVECASCHDPHGVPSATSFPDPLLINVTSPAGTFIPLFLRKENKASGVCFSCHTK